MGIEQFVEDTKFVATELGVDHVIAAAYVIQLYGVPDPDPLNTYLESNKKAPAWGAGTRLGENPLVT